MNKEEKPKRIDEIIHYTKILLENDITEKTAKKIIIDYLKDFEDISPEERKEKATSILLNINEETERHKNTLIDEEIHWAKILLDNGIEDKIIEKTIEKRLKGYKIRNLKDVAKDVVEKAKEGIANRKNNADSNQNSVQEPDDDAR